MSGFTIRRYEPGDADAVWDLHERALRQEGVFDEEFAHLDADLRAIPSEYLEAGGEFLVGHLEGDLVAMGALQPASTVDYFSDDPSTGAIRRMRVDPDHQRRGFGARILARLEARAPELGFERLVLDTTENQPSAIAFYEAHGYRQTGREDTPVGEMIFYEKSL